MIHSPLFNIRIPLSHASVLKTYHPYYPLVHDEICGQSTHLGIKQKKPWRHRMDVTLLLAQFQLHEHKIDKNKNKMKHTLENQSMKVKLTDRLGQLPD